MRIKKVMIFTLFLCLLFMGSVCAASNVDDVSDDVINNKISHVDTGVEKTSQSIKYGEGIHKLKKNHKNTKLKIVNNSKLSNNHNNKLGDSDSEPKYDSIITAKELGGNNCLNKVFKAKLTDLDGNPLFNKSVWFFPKLKKKDYGFNFDLATPRTDENGIAIYKWKNILPAGTYTMEISSFSTYAKDFIFDNVKISKLPIKIKAKKLTTSYKSGKNFKINVVDSKTNKPLKGVELELKVYTGKKYKEVEVTTNSKGVAKYKVDSLSKGTHKIKISTYDGFSYKPISSKIVIKPKRLIIETNSYHNKYCGGLDARIRDGSTKKLLNDIKVRFKIRNGKKYKTYNLVTGYDEEDDLNGVCGLITNKLKVGTHKVKITIISKNYKGTKNAKIKIPKSSKNYNQATYVFTKGKIKSV